MLRSESVFLHGAVFGCGCRLVEPGLMTGDTRYQDGFEDHDFGDERTLQVGCEEWRHMITDRSRPAGSSGLNRCEESVGASKVSSLEVKTKT